MSSSSTSTDFLSWPTRRVCALLFGLVLLAYLPVLGGGFLWDDAGHVTRAELRSFGGLLRIWFEPGATQQYYPLLHSAFWIEHRLWGDATTGYHLVNVLLHAGSACLLGLLLRRLAVPGAWLAALLFALHPVCVESVAWITEQKNTLSTFFYLCAAHAYLRFDAERRASAYALATALFTAALLSKTVTATLPAALLVVLWWKQGRLSWRRDALPLAPWFALGLGGGLATAWMEHAYIGAQGAEFSLSAVERGLLAGRAFWFYLGSLLWPADLMLIYPRWTLDASAAWQYAFPLAALGLVGVLAWPGSRARGLLAGALLYGGSLVPALGFINVYPFIFSFVADHFQYLASLWAFALAGAALAAAFSRVSLWTGRLIGIGLLATLAALTASHARSFRDLATLYGTTLARNPACWMAHNNLGGLLVAEGRADEALAHFERALELRPGFAEAENNLGDALNRLNRSREAIPHLERALSLQPRYPEASCNLGVALMKTGRPEEGLARFEQALALNPRYPVAQLNLGLALAGAGRTEEALARFREAARLDPSYAEPELNLGIGLTLLGRATEATPHFEKALALRPEYPEAHYGYARALAEAGRYEEAVARFNQVLRLEPAHAAAHYQLALVLRRLGRTEEANLHFAEAMRLSPGGPPAG